MDNIGVFGGTFNPPHLGHLHIATAFLQAFQPEELLIIPSYVPPHKASPELASGEDRLVLCKQTFTDPRCKISDLELQRKGRSYTVDTLEELKSNYPGKELYFLVGDDMLLYLPHWREPERLLELAHFVSAVRSDRTSVSDLERFARQQYPAQYAAGRFHFLQLEPFEVSSTELRNKRKAGEALTGLVSAEAEEYINRKGLYL